MGGSSGWEAFPSGKSGPKPASPSWRLYSTCSFGGQRLLCEQLISNPTVTAQCGLTCQEQACCKYQMPPVSSQVKIDEETQGSPKDCLLLSTSYLMSWLLKCSEGFGPLPRAASITYKSREWSLWTLNQNTWLRAWFGSRTRSSDENCKHTHGGLYSCGVAKGTEWHGPPATTTPAPHSPLPT